MLETVIIQLKDVKSMATICITIICVLLICLIFFTGYGLECYQCASAKGWDDCTSNRKKVDCTSEYDRCGKAYVEGKVADVSVALYGKGCISSSVCSQKTCKAFVQDPSTNIDKCELDCCEGDLCNGAKVSMVSAIMLFACALLAFLH